MPKLNNLNPEKDGLLLSIITINYNDKAGLSRTLQSVIAQTFPNFEFIVIDGGSKDGSLALLKEHSAQIDYWVSEPDNGIYHAMNKGVKMAKGDYLLFLNAGDKLVSPHALESAFNRMRNQQKDIVYCKLKYEMSYGRVRVATFPRKLTFKFMAKSSLPHPATFISRSLFDANRVGWYDESHPIASDWKFFLLALFKHRASYQYIPIPLSLFSYGGISTTMDAQLAADVKNWRAQVLQQNFPEEFKRIQRNTERIQRLKQYFGVLVIFGWLKKLRRRLYDWTGV